MEIFPQFPLCDPTAVHWQCIVPTALNTANYIEQLEKDVSGEQIDQKLQPGTWQTGEDS